MTKYTVDSTPSSPAIEFDPEGMFFEIKGESYPENCWSFYQPMFTWLETFFANQNPDRVEINMEILYFNSSSSKTFMDFFEMLDEQVKNGRSITLNWRYHEENEIVMECGEEFKEDVERINFKLIELTDTTM